MSKSATASRFAGHIVIVGVGCLFLGMMLALLSIAMSNHGQNGSALMPVAQILLLLFIPIAGTGIMLRVIDTGPEPPKQSGEDSDGSA